uniref:mRNA 3'-end-processing protein n=1 Tax=Blastobotrys adeninivorans TaxID=409370 RepID=A0A060SXH3_BLAAD
MTNVVHPQTEDLRFSFDDFLRREYRFGMDPTRPICRYFAAGQCPRGKLCPDKHILPSYSNKIVCKHWLRGLCKKGDACEFLHEYNLRKMPECLFFSKNGFCTQSPDCLYLHIDPASKIPLCPNYEKGFCKLGPKCTRRHVRKEMCPRYLTGFCPEGPNCDLGHPKFVAIGDNMRIARDPTEEPAYIRSQSSQPNAQAEKTDSGEPSERATPKVDGQQQQRQVQEVQLD